MTFSCPTSGQMIGMIVKAFRLTDPEIGGPFSRELNATLEKTTQRFFRGERIDSETRDRLCRQFAKALFHSRLLGHFDGAVQSLQGPTTWEAVFESAVVHNAMLWDSQFCQSAATFSRADHRLATLIFARHIVIELALRQGCLVLLGHLSEPIDDCPWWATARCFGNFLKQHKENCQVPPSGSEIAAALEVDERTVDRWFAGQEIPSLLNTDSLAHFFSARSSNTSSADLLRSFRFAAGIGCLMNALSQQVGAHAVERLGRAQTRFVRWTLEGLSADEMRNSPAAHSLFASIIVAGLYESRTHAVVLRWAALETEIPWREDILMSHPAYRSRRLIASLAVVGEAELVRAGVRAKLPDVSPEELEALLEGTVWLSLSSPHTITDIATLARSAAQSPAAPPLSECAMQSAFHMQNAQRACLMQDFKSACVEAARAVALQPEEAECRYMYGAALWQAHRWGEAEEQLRECCRLRPDWDRPFVEIGVMYDNRGLSDTALHHLQSGPPVLRDGSAWCQMVMGRIHWRHHRHAEALVCFRACIALEPKNGEALDYAADCAFRLGDFREGERLAKEAKHRGVPLTFEQWQGGGYPKAR